MKTTGLTWADAAEERTHTITEWFCKTCGRRWGRDEHTARYCCAIDRPCDHCGATIPGKSYTRCDGCRRIEDLAKWLAKPEVPWDGEFPIALWDSDNYFWSIEEVVEWMVNALEFEEGDNVETLIDDLQLTTCVKRTPRRFDAEYLFEDYLAEDQDPPDCSELEKFVNEWMQARAPEVWEATGKRLRLADIKPALVKALNDDQPN